MRVFAYCIAADLDQPPLGEGFIRAEKIEEAVRLHGHPDVNVALLPADAAWPGPPDKIIWRCR